MSEPHRPDRAGRWSAPRGGFYHRSVKAAIDRDGDTLSVLDVLAKQVGVRGMFSDWPATTTFHASCMGMK